MEPLKNPQTTEYAEIVASVAPAVGVAAFVAFSVAFRRSYYQKTWKQRIGSIVTAIPVGATAGGVMALAAPYLVEASGPDLVIVLSALGGAFGIKIFDMLFRRVFGLSTVDFKQPTELKEMLTPEERIEHVRICPFKGDECRGDGSRQSP